MTTHSDTVIPVHDLGIRCRVDGAAGASWIVFSNSLMTDLSLWDDQVAHLASRFRILRYDHRGHGGSTVPPGACRFEDLTDDLIAVMDAHGIETATLVGVSMGGVTVLGAAARYPARVARVMVCDCQPGSTAASAAAWEERIGIAEAGGMAALVEPTVARWLPPATVQADTPAVQRIRAMIAATPFQGFVQATRALQDYESSAQPAVLRCPAAFVAGVEDGTTPQAVRAMAAMCPGATVTIIEGAGHLPNIEQPVRFNAALDALLAQPAASRPTAS